MSNPSSSLTDQAASEEPTYGSSTRTWKVSGAGHFNHKREFNFSNKGCDLPEGLEASNYTVHDTCSGAPYNHIFETQNVYSDGEVLNLKVPGVPVPPSGDSQYAISSAQIETTEDKILYASVRTKAIFSTVHGTCHGGYSSPVSEDCTDVEAKASSST